MRVRREAKVGACPGDELVEVSTKRIDCPVERIRAWDLDERLVSIRPAQVVVRNPSEAIESKDLFLGSVDGAEHVQREPVIATHAPVHQGEGVRRHSLLYRETQIGLLARVLSLFHGIVLDAQRIGRSAHASSSVARDSQPSREGRQMPTVPWAKPGKGAVPGTPSVEPISSSGLLGGRRAL